MLHRYQHHNILSAYIEIQVQWKPPHAKTRHSSNAQTLNKKANDLALLHNLQVAPRLALRAPDNSPSAHLRDVAAQISGIDGRVVEPGLDDVCRHGPETGEDVEGAAVVAVEGAEEEGFFAT